MIFYSHSKVNHDGAVVGSKKLTEHIAGMLRITNNARKDNLTLGLPSSLFEVAMDAIVRFHDFGKYTSFFQNYILKKEDSDGTLKQHARIGGIVAYNLLKKENNKAGLISLFVIFRHHTQLCDILQFPEVFNDELNYVFRKQTEDIQKNISLISKELNITNLEILLKYPDEKELRRSFRIWIKKEPDIQDYFLVNYLFSLLIEADKLDASGTSQYKLRPIAPGVVDNRFGKPHLIDVNQLAQLSNNEIRNFCRAEVVSILERQNILEYNILTLTAPTGIGKTMIALDFALKLKKKIKDRKGTESKIIYALPFINIIEQALSEYESTLPRGTKILGHYQFSDVFGKDDKQNGYVDDPNYSQKLMLLDTWQSDVVITSFVQFFETLVGHRNKLLKKFHHFANSIVILDEVQTLRLDQMPLIGATLFYLSEYLNTKIILMTATKPKIFELAQQEIISAEGVKVVPLELLKSHKEVFSLFKRTKIVQLLGFCFSENLALEFLNEIFLKKWDSSKSCLIVCNTVNRSIELFNIISESLDERNLKNPIHYLSTNIIPFDRSIRIKKIKKHIEDGVAPILISTQVIEAGVDLDFDMGFRDLASIDSIIQVAGRINRNNNPVKKHSPLYVVDFGDANKIYGQITAIQARKALESKAEVPEEEYFDLIDNYFDNISSRSSFARYNKIFESMKRLRYDSEDKENDHPISSFRIIEESQNITSVYIERDEYSRQLRESYLMKIIGKLSKEKFDEKFKTPFQQHIVSIPTYLISGLPSINEYDESLLVVSYEIVDDFYDEMTGFVRKKSTKIYML